MSDQAGQNDSPIGGSFWQKYSLIIHILFKLCMPILIFSPVQIIMRHPLYKDGFHIQTVTYASNTKVSREIFNITLIYWSCEPMYWYQLPMFNKNMPHDDAWIRSGVVLNLIQKGFYLGFLQLRLSHNSPLLTSIIFVL